MAIPVLYQRRSITVLFMTSLLLVLPVGAGNAASVTQFMGSAVDIGQKLGVKAPSVADQVGLITKLPKGVDLAKKGAKALDPSDDQALPDYDPPGMPRIPIGCGAEEPGADMSGCHHCYQKAHQDLQDLRRHFERLRQVYVETDDMVKAQLAFGDGIAGSVGVGALGWMVERDKIMLSFKQFKVVYHNKYQELLGRLEGTLREIAACEREYFGDEDWYNRYGFMFHSFMALHYAR
ncbi:hypothetical protein [Thiocapsa marina]|uniref:Uncharacterized protein n=1 Tax=Thiocapsa marina 5811 TaxID=768671 RepID=F9UIN1_9GAMM|nr:hypothetical protein [Thiocapsa marina]EGV15951.1 hypothetical protein ThimaDRAFT_4784 [Thiocapsa marina 5811]